MAMAGSNDIEVTFITSTTLVGVVIIALFVVAFRTPSITSTRLAAPPFRAFRVAVAIAIGVQWVFLYRAATVMPHRAAWPITGRHSFVRIGRWGSRSLAWRVRLISPSHLTLPLPLPLPPPLPLSLSLRRSCARTASRAQRAARLLGAGATANRGRGGGAPRRSRARRATTRRSLQTARPLARRASTPIITATASATARSAPRRLRAAAGTAASTRRRGRSAPRRALPRRQSI